MLKILIIIAPKDFQDIEYLVPKEIFEKEGFEVVTASTQKDCLGVFGLDVEADVLLSEVRVEKYEGVVLVGGGGGQIFINDSHIHQLLRKFYKDGKIVAAICLSPATLAQAGLLKGKKCTVFPDAQLVSLIQRGEGKYTGNQVEQDGNIVTATDPTASKKFANTILSKLRGT